MDRISHRAAVEAGYADLKSYIDRWGVADPKGHIEKTEGIMNTTMNAEINLTRHSDTGNTITTVMFQHGMPDMIVIEQRLRGDLRNRIEMTMSEAKFIRYLMTELISMDKIAKDSDRADYL